jgi:hypothetical protein
MSLWEEAVKVPLLGGGAKGGVVEGVGFYAVFIV